MSMKPNMMLGQMLGQMPMDPKLSMLLEHAPRWMAASNSMPGMVQPSPAGFLQPGHALGMPTMLSGEGGERSQFTHSIDGRHLSRYIISVLLL